MGLAFKLKKFWVDQTGKCTAEGGFVGDVTGEVIGQTTGYLADGAISPDDTTAVCGTGAAAMTLADGTVDGHRIVIIRTSLANVVITPSNFTNGTTITLDASKDTAELLWYDGVWYALYTNGTIA
ncbi:MAG: hypothetical protein ACYSWP_11480 [Planctomycetota bacterium]|jgi:hypothetical protein